VSSSTSSSRSHRRYVQGLLALVLVPWSGLLAFGVYLQPPYGDLTRIGSHAERDFGWNRPQLEFEQLLSKVGKYDRHFDVVVLGDSFALGRPLPSWQNYVVAATGWSVITLDARNVTPEQVLANRAFRETPPRIFIFESVERQIPYRVPRRLPCDPADVPTGANPPLPVAAAGAVRLGEFKGIARYVERNAAWSEVKPEYVLNYLRHNLSRALGKEVPTDAPRLELSGQAPFSSANRNELLVYKDDIRKIEWWRQMPMPETVCRVEGLRKSIEANGQTRFVLMVAPDKLTAYSDYLRDASLRDASMLSGFADHLPHVALRLDKTLLAAIRQGVEDVYLPNDTHWGSNGHRIAAETLLAFVQR
jgi:hypothetical protein